MKLIASEYFAGIGLVRMGLEQSGWQIAFANAEEKTVSREELVKNVNKAQDAYDIAEEEYNASKTLVESYKAEMDSYAASRNGTTWHDRQDAWQKKYDEARGDWETEKGNLGGKQKN